MITGHLEALAGRWGYPGGFQVSVGVDNGEELAERTMNGRLGIVGGLSILGTTGIVRPYSCAAYIASIQQGIDVARSNGLTHVAACTGSTSEQAMRNYYDLPEMALVEMGDFVGAVLKYMKKVPVEKLSLAGGFGKVSKLAAGHLDLHSRQSSIDFAMLAAEAKAMGADATVQTEIRQANTSLDALILAQAAGFALGDRICRLARERAMGVVPPGVAVEVWAVDRQGAPVGYAGPP
jgi:cobalt-precorrin-5B (C1)-methyltransferase